MHTSRTAPAISHFRKKNAARFNGLPFRRKPCSDRKRKPPSQKNQWVGEMYASRSPPQAREMVALLGREIEHLDTRLAELDGKLIAMHKANPLSQRLATIPGIGVIIALTL